MRNGWVFLQGFALALGMVISLPQTAAASIDTCGKISVEASAQCKIEVQGGCQALCQPVNFVTVCTTKRYEVCKNKCTLEPPTVSCKGSCSADCSAQCTGSAGSIDCQANCDARCTGQCDAYCQAQTDKTKCVASCKGSCSVECDASCNVTPPQATCDARCDASCNGSCKITEPYFSCQRQCQEVEIPDCETTMKGGCELECQQPEGALFCDGQYVDHGDNLKNCINSLNEWLRAQVNVSASSKLSSECTGKICTITASGKISTGCEFLPYSDTPDEGFLATLMLILAPVTMFALRRGLRSRQ